MAFHSKAIGGFLESRDWNTTGREDFDRKRQRFNVHGVGSLTHCQCHLMYMIGLLCNWKGTIHLVRVCVG